MTQLLSRAVFVLAFFITTVQTLSQSAPPQHVLTQRPSNVLPRPLKFDDLPTHSILNNISTYSTLHFSSFTLINTTSAVLAGAISSADYDCAMSHPNALTANRHRNPSVWPRFELLPAAAEAANIAPVFNLHGFSIKAMNETEPWTTVAVEALGVVDGEIRTSYTLFMGFPQAGHQPALYHNISEHFHGWGERVNLVGIYGQARDGTDWDFCIDNLDVEFLERGEEIGGLGADVPFRSMHEEMIMRD